VVYKANGITVITDGIGVAITNDANGASTYLQCGDDAAQWRDCFRAAIAQTRGPLSQMSMHQLAAYISAEYVS
jgi:hypothetical protein